MPSIKHNRSESIKAQNKASKNKQKKTKKSKKDHSMNYHTAGHSIYSTTTATVQSKIKTYKDFSNTGIILMDDDVMQIIRKQSGPLAPSCEYQVHYWSLVVRATFPDESILDICIPTVFFNYKQEVSGARIDFELSDVDIASETLLPIHNMKIQELTTSNFYHDLAALIPGNPTISFLSTNLNSMHKHPGGISQSFSGTDLTTNHVHNTGIVFPLAEGNKKPNFAGIMAHVGADNKVAHFEYRIATGKIDDTAEGVINYYRGRCVSIVKAKPTQGTSGVPPSFAEALFGIPSTPAVPSKSRTYYSTDEVTVKQVEESQTIQAIKQAWESSNFLPFTESVIESNIATKTYTAAKTVSSYGGMYGGDINGASLHHLYGLDDADGNDDWYQQYIANRNKTGIIVPGKTATRTATTISKTTNNTAVNNTSGVRTKRSNTDFDAMENIMELDFKSDIELATISYDNLDFEVRWLTHLYYNEDFKEESPIMIPEYQLKQEYKRLKTLIIANMDYFTIADKSPITVDGKKYTRSAMIKELEENNVFGLEHDSYNDVKEQFMEWINNPSFIQDEE